MMKWKVKKVLKFTASIVYFAITAVVPITAFGIAYLDKESLLYAIVIAYMTFIVMDIICSILENVVSKIVELAMDSKWKRREKRQEKIENLRNILSQGDNYKSEISNIHKKNLGLREEIKNKKLSKKMERQMSNVCNKMDDIIGKLDKDPNRYYSVIHAFNVYFEEYQRLAHKFMSQTNDEVENNIEEMTILIIEMEQYLRLVEVKTSANKLSLELEIKSLINSLKEERKMVIK